MINEGKKVMVYLSQVFAFRLSSQMLTLRTRLCDQKEERREAGFFVVRQFISRSFGRIFV